MNEKYKRPKADNDNIPRSENLHPEPGSEKERTLAYSRMSEFRNSVRISEMPLNQKSEFLQRLHEIQNELSKGSTTAEKALAQASALAQTYNLQF